MFIGPVSLSFVLTLLVFSYLLGDNILFRIAVAVFVGLTAAFTTIVIFESVFIPLLTSISDDVGQLTSGDRIDFAQMSGNSWILLISGILALALLLKPFAGLKTLTNLALAFLIAVGAAIAVVGALTGTLIPLALATAQPDIETVPEIINTVLLVVGVITTLLYFQYLARRNNAGDAERGPLGQGISSIGRVFIAIALGAIYGTAILTSLTILTGHLSELIGSVT